MTLRELTPQVLRCGIGSCPAIFETTNGTYILVGKQVAPAILAQELAGRIAPGEFAVEVPRELLCDLVKGR